jgi:ABC-type transporter Mla subunit MlaD
VRGFRAGVNPVRAGLIALVLIAIASYFAFTKDIPFTHTYRVQAVFENSNLIAPRSPVRIAGIDVGKVIKVGRYKDTKLAVVTMEITDKGRPLHTDATLKIRPRLFLEGNFYIDMKPGTPSTDEIDDGGMIPAAQTSVPVQLDQVLTALQTDTRKSLQLTIKGLGDALGSEPSAADDAEQDPSVQGLTGGQSLNQALQTSATGLRDAAIVQDGLLGQRPHDLSRLVKGVTRASGALASDETALRDLISNFNTTVAATASKAPQLAESVRLLGPFASNLRSGLNAVDRALPPTRAFSREILPGVRETPATIAAAQAWLPQAAALFSKREFGGLLDDLAPATRQAARLAHGSRKFVPTIDDFNRCAVEVLIPSSKLKVEDGAFSSNAEIYKEFWYTMVGQAGEGQSFDGNGSFLRLAAPGGATLVKSGKTNVDRASLFANFTSPPQRTRPAYPAGQLPPLRRDVACHRNPVPDVNGPASIGPADGARPDAPPPPIPSEGSVQSASLPNAAQVLADPGPGLVPIARVAAEGRP